VPLTHDGAEISTLDLFGRGLILLAAAQGQSWADGLRTAADRLGVLATAYRVGTDVQDHTGAWQRAYPVGEHGAVLVRPDGFVAWRSTGEPGEPAERVLGRVLRQILARTGEANT
jgi:hypothetical protein